MDTINKCKSKIETDGAGVIDSSASKVLVLQARSRWGSEHCSRQQRALLQGTPGTGTKSWGWESQCGSDYRASGQEHPECPGSKKGNLCPGLLPRGDREGRILMWCPECHPKKRGVMHKEQGRGCPKGTQTVIDQSPWELVMSRAQKHLVKTDTPIFQTGDSAQLSSQHMGGRPRRIVRSGPILLIWVWGQPGMFGTVSKHQKANNKTRRIFQCGEWQGSILFLKTINNDDDDKMIKAQVSNKKMNWGEKRGLYGFKYI